MQAVSSNDPPPILRSLRVSLNETPLLDDPSKPTATFSRGRSPLTTGEPRTMGESCGATSLSLRFAPMPSKGQDLASIPSEPECLLVCRGALPPSGDSEVCAWS